MGDEDRFNRIEQKLDGITQILQTLAKHDERMVNLALREKRSEERLDAIEKSVLKNSTISMDCCDHHRRHYRFCHQTVSPIMANHSKYTCEMWMFPQPC